MTQLPAVSHAHRSAPVGRRTKGTTVAPIWRKSSYSFSNGNCVEIALLPGGEVGLRDSKDVNGPILRVTRSVFGAFVDEVGACPS
jgi:Domain of unknown function (DUF397)